MTNWMGTSTEPLNGFSWRSGVRRDTTGITFWSDVFLHDAENGDKIAIILVDTQGLFDNETSADENSKIFALSTLLSSCQLLNLSGVIQEDQLQYLSFATEFAAFSSSRSVDSKPFQNFMFLIRDWSNPEEFEFGIEGGRKYLDEVLKVKPSHSQELTSVRQHIKESFDNLKCCLLPYPGRSVARDSTFDGRWSKMDEEFLNEMKILIPELLKPEKLVVKKINGAEMTSETLNENLQKFLLLFQSSKLPQAQSIYESTIESFLMKVIEDKFEFYKTLLGTPKSEDDVKKIEDFAKTRAISAFHYDKKMGTKKDFDKFSEILASKIDNFAVEWRAMSMANILRARDAENRVIEARKEAERIKLKKEEDERKARERIAQLEKEAREREAETARQREELRKKELKIQAEIERQRIAEAQRQRELEEQRRIEEQRRREEEERRRREEEERQKTWFKIEAGKHVNIDVPKPKCEIM